MSVWIVQCLCPDRHCIAAIAGEVTSLAEAETSIATPLQATISDLIRSGAINPWCSLCGAKSETWKYEPGRTRFRTLDEAMPHLRQNAEQQRATREALGDLYLVPPR